MIWLPDFRNHCDSDGRCLRGTVHLGSAHRQKRIYLGIPIASLRDRRPATAPPLRYEAGSRTTLRNQRELGIMYKHALIAALIAEVFFALSNQVGAAGGDALPSVTADAAALQAAQDQLNIDIKLL